jgi:hypothetical protein
MKNIFKVFGIALLASSMLFVSCKKDSETQDKIDQAADGITVTFAGTQWVAAFCTFNYDAQNELIDIQAYKVKDHTPILGLAFNKKEKTYTNVNLKVEEETDEEGTYYVLDGYEKDNIQVVKYWESEQQDEYDWWASTVKSLTVSNFDANTLVLDANLSATMFDYAAWDSETNPVTNPTATKSLEVIIKNFSLKK